MEWAELAMRCVFLPAIKLKYDLIVCNGLGLAQTYISLVESNMILIGCGGFGWLTSGVGWSYSGPFKKEILRHYMKNKSILILKLKKTRNHFSSIGIKTHSFFIFSCDPEKIYMASWILDYVHWSTSHDDMRLILWAPLVDRSCQDSPQWKFSALRLTGCK